MMAQKVAVPEAVYRCDMCGWPSDWTYVQHCKTPMGTPYERRFCESCARRYGLPSREEAPDQWEYAVRTRYHRVYD
jgi:hypothetical protein